MSSTIQFLRISGVWRLEIAKIFHLLGMMKVHSDRTILSAFLQLLCTSDLLSEILVQPYLTLFIQAGRMWLCVPAAITGSLTLHFSAPQTVWPVYAPGLAILAWGYNQSLLDIIKGISSNFTQFIHNYLPLYTMYLHSFV